MNTITDRSFWAELAQNTWRQVLQVATPTIAVIAAGGARGVQWPGVAIALAAAALITTGRALTGLRATASEPTWVQAADRALAAAAGTLLGLTATVLQAASGADWPGFTAALHRLDGAGVTAALAASALAALLHARLDPPAINRPGPLLLTD